MLRQIDATPGDPQGSLPRVVQMLVGEKSGGAEAFFDKPAVVLHEAGLPQLLVIGDNEVRTDALRAAGCDAMQLRFGGLGDFAARLRLRRYLSDFRPDLVIAWMNRAARRGSNPPP